MRTAAAGTSAFKAVKNDGEMGLTALRHKEAKLQERLSRIREAIYALTDAYKRA